MSPPTITYLTDIYFEPGATRHLPDLCQKLNIRRPLLVTDCGLVSLGITSRLPFTPAVVFDDVPGNPTEQSVLQGLSVYRDHKCDGIVAVGGGSPMDCAKCIAVLAGHPQPLEQYAFVHGGVGKITGDKPPVICVPTTAGTGSEVGRGALITMSSGSKLALLSPKLIPEAAVCDPLLTLELPPGLTAACGMDAISHCVETFCSPRFNPVAEAIALDGLRRAVRNIKLAVRDGQDVTARSEMLMAAVEGGLTFQKGLGVVHSLSHALGGLASRRLHHGTLNAIFLPHVLRFNMEACGDKIDRLASLLGLKDRTDLPRVFNDLTAELGLPTRLRDMGVTPEELESKVEAAALDHCGATNPRRAERGDLRELFEAAY
jgi:alcohol dehydrogenase class IV